MILGALHLATRLHLIGVPVDAIKDILGVDKKMLKYYIKATEERKKKVLFKYMEKISVRYQKKKRRNMCINLNNLDIFQFFMFKNLSSMK